MSPPAAASPPAPRAVALGALLVAAVIAVYVGTLGHEFIWDDDLHVAANPTIVGPLGLKEIWTTAAANYFPLVLTSYWLQHAAWGLNPLGYHAVTVGCHIAAALLLWRVLLALLVPDSPSRRTAEIGAWLGAALWALHPVQVESVAWISELKNTQSAIFFLLSIWLWLKWLGRPAAQSQEAAAERRYYFLSLFCALLALLSKPSTVMLPVVLVLVAWWRRGALRMRDVLWLVPFFLLSAVASGWTIWEQKYHSGAAGPEWSQTWPERAVIAGRAGWFYLGKLAWPQGLSFIYPRWAVDARSLGAWLPLSLAMVGLAWLWRARAGSLRPVCFAAAYFVALLFPVLGFFDVYFFRYSYVGDHFQYLASMGPLALAGAGLAHLPRRTAGAMAGTIVLAFAGIAWRQTEIYRDNLALWRATVQRTPDAVMAWLNLGDVHSWAFRYPAAIAAYREAARLRPTDADAHNNLGSTLTLTGDPAGAIAEFERALALRPDFALAHLNYGNALRALDRDAEALVHYAEAARLKPDDAGARNNLGIALAEAGRPAEAIPHLEFALRAKRDMQGTRDSLVRAVQRHGTELIAAGRATDAAAIYQRVLALAPESAELHDRLAEAWRRLGRNREALEEFERAAQLRRERPLAR